MSPLGMLTEEQEEQYREALAAVNEELNKLRDAFVKFGESLRESVAKAAEGMERLGVQIKETHEAEFRREIEEGILRKPHKPFKLELKRVGPETDTSDFRAITIHLPDGTETAGDPEDAASGGSRASGGSE